MTLHLSRFRGVVLMGSADTRAVDELAGADSVDIGMRGAVVAASDVTNYATLLDYVGQPFGAVLGMHPISGVGASDILAVGTGSSNLGLQYLFGRVPRNAGGNIPWVVGSLFGGAFLPTDVMPNGAYISSASFPGQFEIKFPGQPPEFVSPFFVNIGAREGVAPVYAPGLYACFQRATSPNISALQIGYFDSLGTGQDGEYAVKTGNPGTMARQLRFRGIIPYNGHLLGYGFDGNDPTLNDGPNRVMFCNIGDPFKWGNDDTDDDTIDRVFTDSDAIYLGDAGELIRAAIVYRGKCYFGTDRGLHFISGFGRDSFLTDGSTDAMKSFNVIGPGALCEGPDQLLYGVADDGLWSYDGAGLPVAEYEKVRDLQGRSPGFWDCLWQDATGGTGTPGTTNKDLIWMAPDYERKQVLIGIPYCNGARNGGGRGGDTVVIRFHTETRGFTRQRFRNQTLSAAGYFRRTVGDPQTRFLACNTTGRSNIQRYGYVNPATRTAVMPTEPLDVEFGPYAPFSPDGDGVVRRAYIVVSWDSVTNPLPIVLQLTWVADEATLTTNLLTIGPVAPVGPTKGDLWLITAPNQPGLGNSKVSATVSPDGGYLLKTWSGLAWTQIPGQGGHGTRATILVPLTRRVAARYSLRVQQVSAVGRYAVEGIGFEPGAGNSAAGA